MQMSRFTPTASPTALSFSPQCDSIIRRQAYRAWCRLRPSACDWEDVAQEVRMALLRHLRRIMTRANPQTFITVAARREAIRALRRLCRDEYSGALVHIEDDEGILQLFYSSTGTSDDYLD